MAKMKVTDMEVDQQIDESSRVYYDTINISVKELNPHPKSIEIYGAQQNFEDLIVSIQTEGILRPLIVTAEHQIVDGHRRWLAAKFLELETVPCQIREFETEDDLLFAMMVYNRYRQKTPRQIFYESRLLKPLISDRATRRKLAGKTFESSAEFGGLKGETREIVASFFNIGRTKFREIEIVYENEEHFPEIVKKVDRGEITPHKAYELIRQKEKKVESLFDKREKIEQIIESVKRSSLREALREQYLETDAWRTVSEDQLQEEISKALGKPYGPTKSEQVLKFFSDLDFIGYEYVLLEKLEEDYKTIYVIKFVIDHSNRKRKEMLKIPRDKFADFEEADAFSM